MSRDAYDGPYGGYSATEMRELFICDWAYGSRGEKLHHVAEMGEPLDSVGAHGVSACGRRGRWYLPGFLGRLCLERCSQCCRALGLPNGTGSPKNDEALRPWMDAELKRDRERTQ